MTMKKLDTQAWWAVRHHASATGHDGRPPRILIGLLTGDPEPAPEPPRPAEPPRVK